MDKKRVRVFKTWEEVKEAYGWTGQEPIAKIAKQCFEVTLVQREDESNEEFKQRVKAQKQPLCAYCGEPVPEGDFCRCYDDS